MISDILKHRSKMFAQVREFFRLRNVMEVDVPILSQSASIDEHIDLITATCMDKTCYMHSSPEYGMKRLLAHDSGDIFQLSHVFRDGECGARHNPEFTMVEWYRLGFSFEQLIDETCDFMRLFVGDKPAVSMTYHEAFETFCKGHKGDPSWLFATVVEPALDPEVLTVITDFPASQAALAQIEGDIAKRFEVFYNGLELANGYKELTNPTEQRQRLIDNNKLRTNKLPVDNNFLAALEKGMPDCCGVALGFDRLLMLQKNTKDIADVMPFTWHTA
jgi:elongation factor P--(R)-beta-lysine ligase